MLKLRAWLARMRPLLELALLGFASLVGLPWLFGGRESSTQLVLAGVLLLVVVVTWSLLREFVQGVFVRASGQVRVGDRVGVGETLGEVAQVGYRSFTLTTDDGAEVSLSYNELARQPLLRMPRHRGAHRHGFEIELHEGADPVRAIDRIKRIALSSHWSSIVREPEVEAIGGRVLRVTVFALGREHGPAIEALIRRRLEA